jgi:PAS fold
MPGALVYTDKNLNIVVCNDRFKEMYRVPDELLQPGRPYPEFLRYLAENGYYGEGDVDALVAQRVESLRNPSGQSFEDRAPDGRVYRILRRRVVTGGTVTVMTDITEQKRAEEARRPGVDFIFGLAKNARLNRAIGAELMMAQEESPRAGHRRAGSRSSSGRRARAGAARGASSPKPSGRKARTRGYWVSGGKVRQSSAAAISRSWLLHSRRPFCSQYGMVAAISAASTR